MKIDSYIVTLKLFFHFMAIEEVLRKHRALKSGKNSIFMLNFEYSLSLLSHIATN